MKFNNVLELATYAHQGQYRKCGVPYVEHVKRVSAKMERLGMPKFVQDAGMLHDSREDSKYITEQDIIDVCEDTRTIKLVNLLTKVDYEKAQKLPKGVKGYNIKEYNAAIENDFFATMVKIADRIDNVATLEYGDEKFQRKYIKETVDEYVYMANLLTDITNFNFNFDCYDYSADELISFQVSANELVDEFNTVVNNAQQLIDDEIYCPITKEWTSRDEAVSLERDDGVMISEHGLEEYLINPDDYNDIEAIKVISNDIYDYFDSIDEDEKYFEIEMVL